MNIHPCTPYCKFKQLACLIKIISTLKKKNKNLTKPKKLNKTKKQTKNKKNPYTCVFMKTWVVSNAAKFFIVVLNLMISSL